jgi:hypothetical protein
VLLKVDAFLQVGTQLTTFHFSQIDIFHEPKKAFCLELLFLTMFPKGQLFLSSGDAGRAFPVNYMSFTDPQIVLFKP